jgi:hypothetical protein
MTTEILPLQKKKRYKKVGTNVTLHPLLYNQILTEAEEQGLYVSQVIQRRLLETYPHIASAI